MVITLDVVSHLKGNVAGSTDGQFAWMKREVPATAGTPPEGHMAGELGFMAARAVRKSSDSARSCFAIYL